MSDEDNLRDRIAAVMYCHRHPLAPIEYVMGMARGEGMESERGQTNVVQRQYLPWAQAIIDEFGLTVETEPGHDPSECGCSSGAYPAESRVVGRWEER